MENCWESDPSLLPPRNLTARSGCGNSWAKRISPHASRLTVEQDGRFKRVQTKCTDRWNGSSYSCGLYAAHQHAYTIKQIDYFAIYLIQDDIWYIFPAKTLIAQSAVILTPHRADSKHARYKEARDLLDARKHTKATPSDEPAPIVTKKPWKRRKYLRPSAE